MRESRNHAGKRRTAPRRLWPFESAHEYAEPSTGHVEPRKSGYLQSCVIASTTGAIYQAMARREFETHADLTIHRAPQRQQRGQLMTTENTDAGIRILTKAIRKLTAQLAEADHMLGIGYSSHADTMTTLDEERGSRIAAERRWVEQSERVVSLDAVLANMRTRMRMAQQRMDDAMDALTGDFDADTRAGDALAILRGEA